MDSRDILEVKQENLVIGVLCGMKKRYIKDIPWKDVSVIYWDMEQWRRSQFRLRYVVYSFSFQLVEFVEPCGIWVEMLCVRN